MKKIIVGIFMALSIMFGTQGVVFADVATDSAKQQACTGINSQLGGDCTAGGGATVTKIVKVAIELLGWVAGIAAVIMIIIAGLKYITSGGESAAISSAKNSLIYSLVGLLIVALASSIVHWVLSKA